MPSVWTFLMFKTCDRIYFSSIFITFFLEWRWRGRRRRGWCCDRDDHAPRRYLHPGVSIRRRENQQQTSPTGCPGASKDSHRSCELGVWSLSVINTLKMMAMMQISILCRVDYVVLTSVDRDDLYRSDFQSKLEARLLFFMFHLPNSCIITWPKAVRFLFFWLPVYRILDANIIFGIFESS
jgi:hypothetical protein